MTITELITELQKYPGDLQIVSMGLEPIGGYGELGMSVLVEHCKLVRDNDRPCILITADIERDAAMIFVNRVGE